MPNENIIDNLSIEVEGQAQGANQVLDGLVTRLEKLGNVVKNFTKRKVNIGVDNAQVEILRKFANAIEDLNFSKLNAYANLTQQIKSINVGLKPDDGSNLSMFAMGLEDLNIDKFRAYAEISNNVHSIATGLGEKSAPAFATFVDAINRLNIEKAQMFADAFREFGGVHLGFGDTGVENLAGFVVALNMADTERMAEFAKIFSAFEGVKIGVTGNSASAFKDFADATVRIDIEKLRELTRLDFSNMDSLANSVKHFSINFGTIEKTSNKVSKTYNEITKNTVSMNRETRKATHTFSLANTALGRLWNSIKRIAFYRAIRTALKSITQGFAEGIENLYYWSQAWNTSFAPKMDQLATAQLYLKNGFASMFSPLIEYAVPIIDRLIDRLVDMFNVAQELFAKLTGASTWNKAIKYPVTYKEELDDAAGSAKALQNILMDFDEINAINTPRSGSRGSGDDAKDYSKMFELMQTSTGNSPLAKFGDLFEDITGKLERAWGVIKKFKDFIGGLNFKPLIDSATKLWDETLSPIIDELIDDAAWFEEKVLEPITKFLVEKGIPLAIDTLKVSLDNLWKVIKPLKDGLKTFWNENGEWITEMFSSAYQQAMEKIQEAFKAIGKFFDKNGSKIKGIFGNLSTAASYFSPLIKAIAGMLGTTAWDNFITSIQTTLDLLQPVVDLVSGLFNIIGVFATGDGKKFEEGMKDIGTAILEAMILPFKFVLRAIADVLDALGTLSPECKNAAHSIRVFIGDETNELVTEIEDAGVTITKTSDGVWKAVDEHGNYISKTGQKISAAEDEVNQQYAKNIQLVKDLGGEVALQSMDMTQWYQYCDKMGLDPLTGKVIMATEETLAMGVAGTTAANTISTEMANKLAPQVGRSIGLNFGNALWSGLNPTGTGNSIGATIAAQIQTALNAHGAVYIPVSVQFTNANYNQLVTMTRQALGGMGISIQGFATGGFPTPGLFYAGENGIPEIVGTIGGRTAVAGGEEITGIREAIYEQGQREENLLRSLISAVNSKDLTLVANSATGRWVNKALKSYAGVTG